ncbi:hypothetical protein HBI56_223020 [Parastagonospora nodorum]|uniref:CENP-V/GFA domain-containing protein n=1 Tax=Phaeosphaeria nodorum (strain SN15 / ATCC MYA-4574 / FGSC 10173) TaxID=321614 RepID=A0A7U2EZV5_PHANO|nr:hypothetical protein HBH56_147950 [Parastagonospora nodorum]QRC94070.1 hypothetical protein JI435_073520 [Parastagonospora nodorum SN15]KAH3923284.1 hypothetical protein HBH54_212590 [Parastagonospora nodorum]KAH4053946.1 hypothetical protein HBH49_073800 [Parastagonospora nodorum]KAH4128609.1 hypothetical protein HBH47_035900 [Parastagonospora nodorum]
MTIAGSYREVNTNTPLSPTNRLFQLLSTHPDLSTSSVSIAMTDSESSKPPLPAFDPDNCQTYTASCHCETIQYTILLSPPLPQWKVVSCNCSICSRNGYLLVYPERSRVHIKSGEEALKNYSFGAKRNLHKFCEKCGSSVFFDPRMDKFGEAPPDLLGMNVSCLQTTAMSRLRGLIRCVGSHVSWCSG